MALLQRILKFYNSDARRENMKTPMENFTTECLVGILESDKQLLKAFVREVLKIGDEIPEILNIYTQKSYIDKEGNRRFIDVVIEADKWLCFIENKVDSKENIGNDDAEEYKKGQLDFYTEILEDESKKSGKIVFLRYCTKWSELKNENNGEIVHFDQFLWNKIAKFLGQEAYSDNHLIQDFLIFLTVNNMAYNMNFQAKDIVTLENMQENLQRMEQYLQNRLKPIFTAYTGKSDFFKQVNQHNRHILWREGKLNGGYWDICIGFVFDGIPSVSISFFLKKDVAEYINHQHSLKSAIDAHEVEKPGLHQIDSGIYFQYRRAIAAFSDEKDMEEGITKWFKEHEEATRSILGKAFPSETW